MRSVFLSALAFFVANPSFAGAPRDLAVIFKGPTICDGCDSAAADLARRHGLTPQTVGLGETTPEILSRAAVYIVPGGEDVANLNEGWSDVERNAIRDYVKNGGRYLGFCLGAYWAGDWPGITPGFQSLGLIPAHVLAHSSTREDRVEKIVWRGTLRSAYFQDGPSFVLAREANTQLYATYASDGTAAVFISRYFQGKVAASGVHLEAPASWYTDAHLDDPDGHTLELGDALFDDLMAE